MKILNLDIDDLYSLSKYEHMKLRNGENVTALKVCLGEEIKGIPNKIFLSGVKGWNVTNTGRLLRSSFKVKTGYEYPLIWDETIRISGNKNLLFTGVYSKDMKTLLTETRLIIQYNYMCNSIEIIAGGVMKNQGGEDILNLVLAIPQEINYEINGAVYSAVNGDTVYKKQGKSIGLDRLITT